MEPGRAAPGVSFFQAEYGIRDRDVTGVQTCALPISAIKTTTINHLQSVKNDNAQCTTRVTDKERVIFIRFDTLKFKRYVPYCILKVQERWRDCGAEIGRASCRERVLIVDVGE